MERLRLKPETAVKGPDDAPGNCRLTPKLTEQFCKLILRGLPADGVCDYLGISRGAYWNWLQKGRKYLDGGYQPREWKAYGLFVLAFRKATSVYRLMLIDELHTSEGPGVWIRYMAILERRDRRTFGKDEPPGGSEESFDADERYL